MRDVDWRMCLRCMSEGEDGRPMVAPTFIAGSAIENVGGGHCPPDNPSVGFADTSLYTREVSAAAAGSGRPMVAPTFITEVQSKI